MKRISLYLSIGAVVLALLGAAFVRMAPLSKARKAATCTTVTTVAGSLTAAQVNPSGVVTGPVDGMGCQIAVFYDASHAGVIVNATITNAADFGILAEGNLTMQGSQVHGIGAGIVQVGTHSKVTLVDNKLDGCTLACIFLQGPVSLAPTNNRITIVNNTMSGILPSSNLTTGIEILNEGGSTVTLQNNTTTNDSFAGIAIGVFANGIVTLQNNTVTNSTGEGIFIQAVTGSVTIQGNQLKGNKDIGIDLRGMTGVKVVGNSITNGNVGIDDADKSDQIIDNKVCVAPSGTPIDTTAATTPLLLGNTTSTTC